MNRAQAPCRLLRLIVFIIIYLFIYFKIKGKIWNILKETSLIIRILLFALGKAQIYSSSSVLWPGGLIFSL
jgi:hypothetical protein